MNSLENEFVIGAPISEEMNIDDVAGGVEAELNAAFGDGSFERVRAELVGAKVGDELERKAAFAVIFSFFLTRPRQQQTTKSKRGKSLRTTTHDVHAVTA